MKKPIFEGMATALITPITENGVDYEAFKKLIDWQIEQGINALVIAGTTGEASTFSDDEHRDVIDFAVKYVNGRVPVIAGTGSNDTAYALDLTRCACRSGADAVLVVTPYYNKATQKGLIKMFTTIADESTVPVILYDVPSRTGMSIKPETVAVLAEHPNIVGLKAASGNISEIAKTAQLCGDKIHIYSGNDDQTIPIMSLGGKGCISVLSNLMPQESVKMCETFFAGDVKTAAKMQLDFIPLVDALFSEVNPIPVKAAMAKMGFCEDYLRLPLTQMEDSTRTVLYEEMRKAGINI
ncbi:MAG: 4-hydroxy-tetrahydrodipicolinate synthase [Clostridia bacterium]|nr:4-hydroxy-tetrahydrodipicolinate synthase [Clostridia bacterium]